MPTHNPRVHVTFEPSTADILSSLAKQEHKSQASLIRELVIEALERREDRALSHLAEVRDVKDPKTVKHDDAWK